MKKEAKTYTLFKVKPTSHKFKDLGFSASTRTVTPTLNMSSVYPKEPPSSVVGKFLKSLESFNDSLNPVVKRIISKQNYKFPISKDRSAHLTLGRIGNMQGEPVMGVRLTKDLK